MPRISIQRILSVTEYTGQRVSRRVPDIIALVDQQQSGAKSHCSPLDKIEEANRIRVKEASRRGERDEIGLYEFEFEASLRRFLQVLSVSWVFLYGHSRYCETRECVLDGADRVLRTTENPFADKGFERSKNPINDATSNAHPTQSNAYPTQSNDSDKGSISTTDYPDSHGNGMAAPLMTEHRVRRFVSPTFFGWFSIWRPAAHLGPLIQTALVKRGDIDIVLHQLTDPFLSYFQRQLRLDILECMSFRPQCIHDMMKRRFLQHQQQQQSSSAVAQEHQEGIDYTQFLHPQTMSALMGALFSSSNFSEIPENVQSPLCLTFWPVLRLLGLDSQTTWSALFSSIGYVPSEDLKTREIGTQHLDTQTLLRLVSNIIAACPAKDREVPLVFLKALISSNDDYWLQPPKREEYRAHLLRLLLENEKNCLKVFDSEAVLFSSHPHLWNNSPGSRPKDCTLDAQRSRLVIEYLYNPLNELVAPVDGKRKFRVSKIMETQDINYCSLGQINEAVGRRSLQHGLPGAWLLALPLERPGRSTMTLNQVISNSNWYEFFALGLVSGSILPMLLAGGRMPLRMIAFTTTRAMIGAAILETVYIVQERIILSELYYNSPSFMLVTSLAMVPVNALTWAFALSKTKWSLLAFLGNRAGRELFCDSYRQF